MISDCLGMRPWLERGTFYGDGHSLWFVWWLHRCKQLSNLPYWTLKIDLCRMYVCIYFSHSHHLFLTQHHWELCSRPSLFKVATWPMFLLDICFRDDYSGRKRRNCVLGLNNISPHFCSHFTGQNKSHGHNL